jgi:hypothetical protein
MKELIKELPVNGNTNYFIRLLINARVVYEYRIIREDTSWLNLEDRNIYKKPLMGFGYSMGSKGRLAHYKEYMYDFAKENGIDQINPKAIEKLSTIMDPYFTVFEREYLLNAATFLSLITAFIEDKLKNKEKISMTFYLIWR